MKVIKLEGYFDNIKKAEKAIEELHRLGFKAYLDLNDRKMNESNVVTNLAGTDTATSMSDLVLNSGDHTADIEKSPIYAADPNVSGMAGFDEIINLKHKIVVETDDNNATIAMQIIEKIAGSVINT